MADTIFFSQESLVAVTSVLKFSTDKGTSRDVLITNGGLIHLKAQSLVVHKSDGKLPLLSSKNR